MTFRPGIRILPAALVFTVLALSAAFHFCEGPAISASAQERSNDGPPVVKITAPGNNSTYSWNSLVNYSVVVSYLGKSTQYQEIPSSQVLLTARYVPDLSTSQATPATTRPSAGLLDITRSNCLGCHEFRAKAMGPSFAAIAERYPDNQASIDALSRSIREGSTGVFGPASMPPHPEFTKDQLHAMVLWMVQDAANPNVNYYVGTEGAIRMQAPTAPNPQGGMILTASYTAPGPSANSEQAPMGEDTVIVHGR
ncbi:MAG TPA: c-type cytochrome [Acidobacteriaceae bacterium]|jgi:cytochrome c|nr:c-type cytochrome [Acidobacteriaceae bacterium]